MRQQGLEYCRRARHDGNFIALNTAQNIFGVKYRQWENSRALNQARQPACLITKTMKKRIDDKIAVSLIHADSIRETFKDLHILAMGCHRAFRRARCAGCEYDIRDICILN